MLANLLQLINDVWSIEDLCEVEDDDHVEFFFVSIDN